MRKRLLLAPWLLVALAVAACGGAPEQAPASTDLIAAETGDAALGLRYAERNCASCHAVAAGQALSPNDAAPAFGAIANTPGMTRTALNVWLHTPHRSMPDLIVDPEHIEDLSAYLATLKRTP